MNGSKTNTVWIGMRIFKYEINVYLCRRVGTIKLMSMYNMHDIVEYMVMMIDLFARKYNISAQEAQSYLGRYGALNLIKDHYGIMHTQTFEDMIDSISIFCKRKGGYLS